MYIGTFDATIVPSEHISRCIYVNIHTHTHTHMYTHVYMCMCVYIYMYIGTFAATIVPNQRRSRDARCAGKGLLFFFAPFSVLLV